MGEPCSRSPAVDEHVFVTWELFLIFYSAQKGGFMRDAATEGIAILFPDTSPRGAGIEGEATSWDFGVGKSDDHVKGSQVR